MNAKKREIDPTLTKLRELQLQKLASPEDAHAHTRIGELATLIELLTGWYDDMNTLETERLVQLLTLGAAVQKFLDGAGKIAPFTRPKSGAKKQSKGGA